MQNNNQTVKNNYTQIHEESWEQYFLRITLQKICVKIRRQSRAS